MFLIARAAQELASWNGAKGETRAWEANSKDYSTESFSHKAERYEYNTSTKNSFVYLHRAMDTQDLVFAEREASSARAVASTHWKRLATHAHDNSSQSRIHRVD
jgi:hypothetical protein